MPYHVRGLWDADAGVRVATSDDVPGLVAEAPTLEGLVDDVRAMVRELLELNTRQRPVRIEVNFITERSEAIELTA